MSRQEPVWVSVVNLVTGTKGPPGGESGTITPSKGPSELRRDGTPGSGPSHSGGQRAYATPVRKPPSMTPATHSGDMGHLLCTPSSTGGVTSGLAELHVCESPATSSSANSKLDSRRSFPGRQLSNAASQDTGRAPWLASGMRSEAEASSSKPIRGSSAIAQAPTTASGTLPEAGNAASDSQHNSEFEAADIERSTFPTRGSKDHTTGAADVAQTDTVLICKEENDCSTAAVSSGDQAAASHAKNLSTSDGASQREVGLDTQELPSVNRLWNSRLF